MYISQFEVKALYISHKLIKLKKKKTTFAKPVEYLKTSWYVIPLPSNDDNYTKSKKKNYFTPNIGLSLILLYKYYDIYFKLQKGFFKTSYFLIYNPDKFSYINKFDHNIRFDVLRGLKNVYRLLAEQSFFYNNIKFYFSIKKFKFFTTTYFKSMFKFYRNPNLPLAKKWGENYTAKQEGTSLLLVRDIIYRQLVVESLNLNYKFSLDELAIFKIANIDPSDPSFFWPTWRLYLIGISTHDGWITSTKLNFYRSFSEIPTSEIKIQILNKLKKLILAQFLYWKEIYLDLAKNNKLVYNYNETKNFKFNYSTILFNDFNFKQNNTQLNEFINKKFFQQSSITITQIPTPTHYFGTTNTFFKKNYLNIKLEKLPKNYLLLLNESNLEFFLKKLSFFELNNHEDNIILDSIYNFNLNNKKYYKIWKKFLEFEFLSPKKAINLLNSSKVGSSNQEFLIPIPEFLKNYFFLLTQVDLNKDDLDEICIFPFLKNLSSFKFEEKKAKKKTNDFLSPLLIYKKYLNMKEYYNIPSATFAYEILKNILKTMPNKDLSLRWTEPFGLNPFFKIVNNLNSREVPFPESVNVFTFFTFLKKKTTINHINLTYKKNVLLLNNFIYFGNIKYYRFLNIQLINLFKKSNFNLNKSNFNLNKRFCLFFKLKFDFLKKQNKLDKSFKLMQSFYAQMDDSDNFDNTNLFSLNPINTNNYDDVELNKIRNFNMNLIKKNNFIKLWEQKKTFFIINTMYKTLWLTNYFKHNISTYTVVSLYRYLTFSENYTINTLFKKISFINKKLLLYNFNYLNYLKIFFFIKYFFINFGRIIKIKFKLNK